MSKTLRIGVIGVGNFANEHMARFAELDDVEVVAFCRRDPAALDEMQRRWDVPHGFSDYKDLLAHPEVDAVSVITPVDTHMPVSLAAFEAGKHVLCEKPLALSSKDSLAMWRAAEASGLVHVTNFNQRGRTPIGRMKSIIDRGEIGTPYHMNIWWGQTRQLDASPQSTSWRFKWENGGGVIYAINHVFDMVRFALGEVSRICTLAATSEPFRAFPDVPEGMEVEVPDSVGYLIECENGATAVIHVSWVSRGTDANGKTYPRIEIAGEKGRLESSDITELRGVIGEHAPVGVIESGDPYPQPYEQFRDAVLHGKPALQTFEDGYKTAVLTDAAIQSASEERWVRPVFEA